jgi:hypothetical protein
MMDNARYSEAEDSEEESVAERGGQRRANKVSSERL